MKNIKKGRLTFRFLFITACVSLNTLFCNTRQNVKRIGLDNLKYRLSTVVDTLGYTYTIDNGEYRTLDLYVKNYFEVMYSLNDFRRGRYTLIDSETIVFALTPYNPNDQSPSYFRNCTPLPPIPFELPEDMEKRNDSINALSENVLRRNISERILVLFSNCLKDTCKIQFKESTMILRKKNIELFFESDSIHCF